MKFSERKGLKPISSVIQKDGMTQDLRNTLWSFFDFVLWSKDGFVYQQYGDPDITEYSRLLWYVVAKKPVDSLPDSGYGVLEVIRKYFFSIEWYEVYDFVEFTLKYMETDKYYKEVNAILERELAGYRFVDGLLTDITSEEEIKALEETLSQDEYPGVKSHLRRALELLSDKKNPDFRNSIKESISAVESIAKELTGNSKATLGDALKILDKEKKLHPALKDGFSKIYGYTSDEGGIRHAMSDEPNIDSSDAKFFLIACSSFINYLKSKRKPTP